jgi:hypothetical protein
VAVAVLIAGGLTSVGWLLPLLVVFGVIAVLHAHLLNRRDRAASAVAFYERSLARVRDEWTGQGRSGLEYLPEEHEYARDLDLFGRGGLFELLCTARTAAGEATLARWLLAPAGPEVVVPRQQAVRELVPRLDMREAVAVMGDVVRGAVRMSRLREWAMAPVVLSGSSTRLALAILVGLSIAALVRFAVTGTLGIAVLILLTLQAAVALWLWHRVEHVIHAADEPSHDLDVLAGLLRILERERFESPALQRLQEEVAGGARPASAEIARLSQFIALLSSRDNLFFAVPAALLMWATQWAFAIEAWRARVGPHLVRWLDAVGELEALLAFATFAFDRPGYAFPIVVDGPAELALRGAAHPALPAHAVANDVVLGGGSVQVLVVSGSNMSGKSTLLRSVGVNVVLAQAGAPVRAASLRLSPLAVGAAIRIQDSLVDGRSHFFAEIRRLKTIVDLAKARGGRVLFLLDEMLAGTNSHDRRIGAAALLRGLVADGAIGLLTTHDLTVAAIADELAPRAANVHFDDRFVEGALAFDYTLRPGIVRSSNAIALMRSIGLDV